MYLLGQKGNESKEIYNWFCLHSDEFIDEFSVAHSIEIEYWEYNRAYIARSYFFQKAKQMQSRLFVYD